AAASGVAGGCAMPAVSAVLSSGAPTSPAVASEVSAIGEVACCSPFPGLSVLDTLRSVPRRIGDTAVVRAVPEGLPVPETRAAFAVAFCPSPPLLLPAVEGRAEPPTRLLRGACAEAVAAMLAIRPEVVVVVGAGAAEGERFGTGDAGSLAGFGVALEIPFDGRVRPGGRQVPLAHTVGAWLLDEAAFGGTRVGVAPGELGGLLNTLPGPVGVLAMGDGSARRSVKAPGYLDDAAEPFDAAVAAAMTSGDAAGLAALDADEGERLLAAGVPTWQAVGTAVAGRRITARLRYDAAPFGVGYLAADWGVA
ncbi:MAG: uncharacterized protein JWQ45_1207, partial [Blastococcus sp.]|nr:uncharacterized protein [Blastococcus sp.]